MSEAYLALSPWVQLLADGTAERTAQALTAISGLTATTGERTVRLLGPAHLADESLPPGFLAEAALSGEVNGNLLVSMAMPDALSLARTLLGVGAECETMDEVTMAAVQEGTGQAAAALEATLSQITGRQFKVDLKPGSVHDRPIAGSELVTEGEEGIVELGLAIAAGTENFSIRAFLDLTTILDLESYAAAAGAGSPGRAAPAGLAGVAGGPAAVPGPGAGVWAGAGAAVAAEPGRGPAPGGAAFGVNAGLAATGTGAAGVPGGTAGAGGRGTGASGPYPTPAFASGAEGEPRVQPAHFGDLAFGTPERDRGNIDLLMDVPLSITVELGRTRRLVRDILSFGPGSVVELDKTAGESLDILVNGRLIARGEVVIVNENFGIRVTEISSQMEKAATPR